ERLRCCEKNFLKRQSEVLQAGAWVSTLWLARSGAYRLATANAAGSRRGAVYAIARCEKYLICELRPKNEALRQKAARRSRQREQLARTDRIGAEDSHRRHGSLTQEEAAEYHKAAGGAVLTPSLLAMIARPARRRREAARQTAGFGEIHSCEVIRSKRTADDCEAAYFKMDNVLIDDRRIHVDFCQSVAKGQSDRCGWQAASSRQQPAPVSESALLIMDPGTAGLRVTEQQQKSRNRRSPKSREPEQQAEVRGTAPVSETAAEVPGTAVSESPNSSIESAGISAVSESRQQQRSRTAGLRVPNQQQRSPESPRSPSPRSAAEVPEIAGLRVPDHSIDRNRRSPSPDQQQRSRNRRISSESRPASRDPEPAVSESRSAAEIPEPPVPQRESRGDSRSKGTSSSRSAIRPVAVPLLHPQPPPRMPPSRLYRSRVLTEAEGGPTPHPESSESACRRGCSARDAELAARHVDLTESHSGCLSVAKDRRKNCVVGQRVPPPSFGNQFLASALAAFVQKCRGLLYYSGTALAPSPEVPQPASARRRLRDRPTLIQCLTRRAALLSRGLEHGLSGRDCGQRNLRLLPEGVEPQSRAASWWSVRPGVDAPDCCGGRPVLLPAGTSRWPTTADEAKRSLSSALLSACRSGLTTCCAVGADAGAPCCRLPACWTRPTACLTTPSLLMQRRVAGRLFLQNWRASSTGLEKPAPPQVPAASATMASPAWRRLWLPALSLAQPTDPSPGAVAMPVRRTSTAGQSGAALFVARYALAPSDAAALHSGLRAAQRDDLTWLSRGLGHPWPPRQDYQLRLPGFPRIYLHRLGGANRPGRQRRLPSSPCLRGERFDRSHRTVQAYPEHD
uniref:Protein kinase domain-containing protein n=1 Tax=Macrostomum lignano TaxID=282301 RepID=A0A1I8JLN5_9PLAT